MAKPFRLTPAQARQQKRDLDAKDRLVLETQAAMDKVLRAGVEQVYAHFVKTGKFKAPNLDGFDKVGDDFYVALLRTAVKSCKNQQKVKKLAKLPEGNLPEGPEALDKVLRNRRYFQKVMRRKKALFGRAKIQYLERLKEQFKKITPLFELGDMSPKDVKNAIADAWKSSKARTETIFRTETTNYFAKTQVAYFEDNDEIIGFLFDSIRDTARTKWCSSRHGLIYRPGTKLLETNTPPCHWNCRSHLIPLVNDPENRKLLQDSNRDPELVKVVALPPGWKN